jgi:hypothetical protein
MATNLRTFAQDCPEEELRAICEGLFVSQRAHGILVAHPPLHTAEGQFFRRVFSQACETLGLSVIGIRERDLDESLKTKFGRAAVKNIKRQISVVGRTIGPPWTQDQKAAAQAALAVLGEPVR